MVATLTGHFASQVRFAGQKPNVLPEIEPGEVHRFTALDYAVLAEMGYEVNLNTIPEPSTWALGLLGLVALGFARRGKPVLKPCAVRSAHRPRPTHSRAMQRTLPRLTLDLLWT